MAKKRKNGVKLPKPEVCTFCEKIYMFPCHGKRYECGNAVWIRSKGKVDYYKLPLKEIEKLKKTGKIPPPSAMKSPIVTPKPSKPKRRRVRLND